MLRDSGRAGAGENVAAANMFVDSSGMEKLNYIPYNVIARLPKYDEHSEARAQLSDDLFPFRLPGAKKFQKYLQEHCGAGLQVRVPRNRQVPFEETRVVGEDIYYTQWKVWEIHTSLSLIGTYFVGPSEKCARGVSRYRRRYEGIIPGRINRGIVEMNKEHEWVDKYGAIRPSRNFVPEETVVLQFGYRIFTREPSSHTEVIFKRFDGHTDIPFP